MKNRLFTSFAFVASILNTRATLPTQPAEETTSTSSNTSTTSTLLANLTTASPLATQTQHTTVLNATTSAINYTSTLPQTTVMAATTMLRGSTTTTANCYQINVLAKLKLGSDNEYRYIIRFKPDLFNRRSLSQHTASMDALEMDQATYASLLKRERISRSDIQSLMDKGLVVTANEERINTVRALQEGNGTTPQSICMEVCEYPDSEEICLNTIACSR